MQAITWNSSAVMGMTRSRSALDGAMTSSAMTSPLGRRYWRMLSWDSSSISSLRAPVCRSVSTASPLPERGVLGEGDVDGPVGGLALGADVRLAVDSFVAGVAGGEQPPIVTRADGDALAWLGCGGGDQQRMHVLALVFDRGDEDRQQRLQDPGAVVHAFLGPPPGLGARLRVAAADRARRGPTRPLFGLLGGPALQVQVEGTHVGHDRVGAERVLPSRRVDSASRQA